MSKMARQWEHMVYWRYIGLLTEIADYCIENGLYECEDFPCAQLVDGWQSWDAVYDGQWGYARNTLIDLIAYVTGWDIMTICASYDVNIRNPYCNVTTLKSIGIAL